MKCKEKMSYRAATHIKVQLASQNDSSKTETKNTLLWKVTFPTVSLQNALVVPRAGFVTWKSKQQNIRINSDLTPLKILQFESYSCTVRSNFLTSTCNAKQCRWYKEDVHVQSWHSQVSIHQ